jgi:hypothetical protein
MRLKSLCFLTIFALCLSVWLEVWHTHEHSRENNCHACQFEQIATIEIVAEPDLSPSMMVSRAQSEISSVLEVRFAPLAFSTRAPPARIPF